MAEDLDKLRQNFQKLIEQLRTDNRQQAITDLANIKDSQIVYWLVDYLLDDDIYFFVVDVLRKLGALAVPVLIEIFEASSDRQLRSVLANILGAINDEKAIPVIIESINKSINAKDVMFAISMITVLARFETAAVHEFFLSLLESNVDKDIYFWLITKLGERKSKLAIPLLIELLAGEDVKIAAKAAYSLGLIGDVEAVPYLVQALLNNNNQLRTNSAQALGDIKDKSAVSALIQALQDENVKVRNAAIIALAEIGDSSAAASILKFVQNEDKGSLAIAIEATGLLADKKALAVLKKISRQTLRTVRSTLGNPLQIVIEVAVERIKRREKGFKEKYEFRYR